MIRELTCAMDSMRCQVAGCGITTPCTVVGEDGGKQRRGGGREERRAFRFLEWLSVGLAEFIINKFIKVLHSIT